MDFSQKLIFFIIFFFFWTISSLDSTLRFPSQQPPLALTANPAGVKRGHHASDEGWTLVADATQQGKQVAQTKGGKTLPLSCI